MSRLWKAFGIGVLSGAIGAGVYAVAEQVAKVRGYDIEYGGDEPCVAEKAKCSRSREDCPLHGVGQAQPEQHECPFGMSICPYADAPYNKPFSGCCPPPPPPHRCHGGCPPCHRPPFSGVGTKPEEQVWMYCPVGIPEECSHIKDVEYYQLCPNAYGPNCPGRGSQEESDAHVGCGFSFAPADDEDDDEPDFFDDLDDSDESEESDDSDDADFLELDSSDEDEGSEESGDDDEPQTFMGIGVTESEED